MEYISLARDYISSPSLEANTMGNKMLLDDLL